MTTPHDRMGRLNEAYDNGDLSLDDYTAAVDALYDEYRERMAARRDGCPWWMETVTWERINRGQHDD